VFIGGWLGYEIARFFGGFRFIFIELLHFLVLCGLFLFFNYGISLGPLGVGYTATRVFGSGWIEYFGGQGMY